MSASSRVVDVVSVKSTEFSASVGGFSGKAVEIMRRQLVDAQVEVLRMYLEKRSQEQLLGALDRLIECTRASFDEEEALMDCFAPDPDPVHKEMHSRVLARLMALRDGAREFDRGRLLAQLIFIDRELTAHILEVAPIPECH